MFVEGEAGFKEARDFMRMLMPSQAKKVQLYREPTPLFVKHRVEDHLSQIYSPVVPLRSGGYLVINQTEALVAVDVNSGKSTRERNIEATALKTNMEAAEEAARQLRLRDLAGLIVIDFIDMDESKNNRAVEKKLKDCLKDDRARVQMGKISAFGLMEISRQRRRSGVLEGTTHVCEHCQGTGRIRSVESSALAALRTLELEALKGGGEATLKTPRAVGLYILNEKRAHLARLHKTLGIFVTVLIDDDMAHAEYLIERTSMEQRPDHALAAAPIAAYEPMVDDGYDDEAFEDEDEDEEEDEHIEPEAEDSDDDQPHARADERPRRDDDSSEDGEGTRRGRRRRRRGRRDGEPREAGSATPAPRPVDSPRDGDDQDGQGRRRRRGRRGGRRMRDDSRPTDGFAWTRPWVPYGDDPFVWYDPSEDMKTLPVAANELHEAPRMAAEAAASAPSTAVRVAKAQSDDDIWVELPAADDKPKRARRGRSRGRSVDESTAPVASEIFTPSPEPQVVPASEPEPVIEPVAVEVAPPAKKPRASRAKAKPAQVEIAPQPEAVIVEPQVVATATTAREPDPTEISAAPATPRKGWWRRG